MEQAPRARAREPDAAWENAVQKTGTLYHEDKAVEAPARVKAGDQARAQAGVKAKAEAPDRAAVGNLNILTN